MFLQHYVKSIKVESITENNNNNDFYSYLQKNDLTYINYINQAPKGASNIQGIAQLLRSIKKLETIINIKSNFRIRIRTK